MFSPRGAALAVCVLLAACSGGKDTTAPELPADEDVPGPPQATNKIAGTYTLRLVNAAQPGQAVTLFNPDGQAFGTYRFDEGTMLKLTEEQTWSLALHFGDEVSGHEIQDRGRFKRYGDDGRELYLNSEVYGDVVYGEAYDGMAFMLYDVDGNGQPETAFAFERTGT
jgi:hypothetical protein